MKINSSLIASALLMSGGSAFAVEYERHSITAHNGPAIVIYQPVQKTTTVALFPRGLRPSAQVSTREDRGTELRSTQVGNSGQITYLSEKPR